ncbi:MAG: ABC transporter substrate-binding protein [Ruminococcus sp.]|nr:ABC transporter substrate-binding protein [Ruminococcus sp.]
MKHNKIFALLLAGTLSFGMVGCDSTTSSDSNTTEKADTASSSNLKPLRLGCPGFDDYPLLENGKLAYDKGYLEEELNAVGYTLDLVTFQEAGPAINEAYASGELDMAIYGEYPAATAYSNGVDICIIGVADKQMNAGVLAQKDSGIQTPKDLELVFIGDLRV